MSRRTNPGRVALYGDAARVVRENRRELAQAWLVAIAAVLFCTLFPGIPGYLRGLLTGTMLTLTVAASLWFVWHVNGLDARLEGTWAEEWTNEELAKASTVLEVVPSLRFDRFDVDHIAIARHGVYLVETKRHRMLYPGTIERDLEQAASTSRTARNFLLKGIKFSPPPKEMIATLLVYWGRAGRDLEPSEYETTRGTVTLIGGMKLTQWLDGKGNGYVGPDYARSLADELTAIAETRESHQAPSSRMIRWFSRTG